MNILNRYYVKIGLFVLTYNLIKLKYTFNVRKVIIFNLNKIIKKIYTYYLMKSRV